MPRGKKRVTQSGADAQDIASVPGQRYGEGVAQQAMQRAMPAPDLRGQAPDGRTMQPAVPDGGSPATPPPDLATLLGGAPTGLLGGSHRPNQPVTAGLSLGPGPGPEILGSMRATTPLARTLRTLTERTGDRSWSELADRAGL
jgi:hypothetical protein